MKITPIEAVLHEYREHMFRSEFRPQGDRDYVVRSDIAQQVWQDMTRAVLAAVETPSTEEWEYEFDAGVKGWSTKAIENWLEHKTRDGWQLVSYNFFDMRAALFKRKKVG